MVGGRPILRHPGVRAIAAMAPLAFALLVLSVGGGCREPTDAIPPLAVRAASADSTHLEIEFPEALDPVAMADTSIYRVEMPLKNGPPVGFAVRSAAVVDTIRGRCVRLETARVPDGVQLLVRVTDVRLLTGQQYGREGVTVSTITGLSYGKDIAPLFASSCNGCHSGTSPAGDYATDSYYSLFSVGTSPPENLLPGNPACLLIEKSDPGASMFYQGMLEFLDADMIRNWAVFYMSRP